jgi:acetyl esterase/lipase
MEIDQVGASRIKEPDMKPTPRPIQFILSALAVILLADRSCLAENTPFVKTTHTFKTVGAVKIVADIYRPDDVEKLPVVVWIHGGALINGNRNSVPRNLSELCRKERYVLVSIEYRLAPEVKIASIIEDVEDAFKWLHDKGPTLLNIDARRIVVTGGSAGGYLTLMTGFRVKPRPTALVAYWGYGDVDGDWYTKPSEHYRKSAPLVDKETAFKGVGAAVIAGTDGSDGQKFRGRFYLYLRQNGLWTKEVTGFDPEKDRSKLDPFCPVRNVTADFPPTMLVHGTEDTDVPYELSANMAKELARHKVQHELVTVRGAGHGLSGGDKKIVDAAYEKSLAFIREKLK